MDDTLEKIYNSISKFLVPLTLEEVYPTIVSEAEKLVEARFGSLFLDEGGELTRVYTTLPVASAVKIRKRGFTYQSFISRKAMVKAENDFGKYHPEIRKLGIKSNIFIPLSHGDNSIGVLIVNSHESREFTQKDLDVLKIFGTYSSLAIQKSQHFEDLRKALDMRDVFLSMASHELRTPLTSINGYIQLLHSKIGCQNTSEARWVGELKRESERLTRLVKELLEINRIRAGQFQYSWQEYKIRDIIQQAINNFDSSFPERVLIYEDRSNGATATVIGDPGKLIQAFDNVLENAVKYSDAPTGIKMTFNVKDNHLIIKIKDQGKGIPKEDLPKVFDRFYRAENHKQEGIGIGLFLVKDIIDHHRGRVKILSRVGKGTTVEITLVKANV